MQEHLSAAVAQHRAFTQVIDGRGCEAVSGARIEVVCPSDGQVFASIPASDPADVDLAVRAARRAFDDGPWSRTPAVERGRCLTRLGHLVEQHGAELAALESRDTGKPARQGRADVVATMRYFEFYGGAADKIHGDTIPFLDGYTALTIARAARRGGRHHPVELPDADSRPRCRRGARDGQHAGRQAGGRCLAHRDPHRRTAAEAGFPDGVFNVVTGCRRGCRGGAFRPPVGRLRDLHRLSRNRHRDPDRRRPATIAASPWNLAASRRRSCLPTPTSTRRCRFWSTQSCRMAARPARRAVAS